PEDRTIADGPRVELAVVRIHYDGVDPRPEPVLYLHGGPGGGTLASGINGRVEFGRQMRRDLIVFDQRGTGLSEPSLECPEREAALIDALSDAAAWEIELDAFRTATSACFERLTAEGHDLSQYHTYNNAADVADLRTALGVDDWTLWGTSYGTRVGLAVLRSFPEGVRSVVFDSVYPPDYADISGFVDSGLEAFDRLANGCGTDPNCEATYGDLKALLTRAIASLDAEPFGVDLTLADGTTRRLAITGNDAAAGLFNAMYDTTLIPMLPRVIADIAGGGRSMVGLIAQMGIPAINSITEGAFLSYECADNGARINQSEVDELVAEPGIASTILLAGWQLFCRDWPVRQLPADFGDEVTSDVPALVFAGEYDPVTPAANSKRAAEALGNATFVQVARSGHGVARESGCTTGLMIKFLDDPTVVDTSCVAGIPFPPFG
ncbi:MAG: alpha/beta fold hydrolase, partial [Actinobacteria bacterium]|nr:alpha/beta fold hydrolase [Actinomycetota bacterium]